MNEGDLQQQHERLNDGKMEVAVHLPSNGEEIQRLAVRVVCLNNITEKTKYNDNYN